MPEDRTSHHAPDALRVSIIIPAYNVRATLTETLESVLSQTLSDWEAIIVDDGSTDGTFQIAASFARRDSRIRVLRQENAGESAARNAAISAARYEWLVFLDADDWISPSYLERLVSELQTHPDLDAVHCGSVRVARDGTHVEDDYRAPSGDLFPTLARRAAFPVHACMVRKSIVEEVGKFDTSLQKSADWDLWQRVARTGARFGAVREVLAYYRMTPNSSSLGAEQLLQDGLQVLRRGHECDERVSRPHPGYENGWQQDSVESQEFYLLSWCAGLLLGGGKDARRLLKATKNDRYPGLYADAIARCIFEAAAISNCSPPLVWEALWPRIHLHAERFLDALEQRSGTPGLARQSIIELKRKVLKYSRTWSAVIRQFEEHDTQQHAVIQALAERCDRLAREARAEKAALEKQVSGYEQLQKIAVSLRADLVSSREFAEELQQQKTNAEGARDQWRQTTLTLELELKKIRDEQATMRLECEYWQRTAEYKGALLLQLQSQTRIRLGGYFGLVVPFLPDERNWEFMNHSSPAIQEAGHTANWELRTAEDNVAHLFKHANSPETFRVAIAKAATGAPCDIQLNRSGFAIEAAGRYILRFRVRAQRRRSVHVGVARACDPWDNLGYYREIKLNSEWMSFAEPFTAALNEENARIHFDLGAHAAAFEVSHVSIECSEDSAALAATHSPGE